MRTDPISLPEIQYFLERTIRQGVVTNVQIKEASDRYGSEDSGLLLERLMDSGVQVVEENDLPITPRDNVLLNDLTLVELISLALNLPPIPKLPKTLYAHILRRRSYELDLYRLHYLDYDQEWYYLSPTFNRLQYLIRDTFASGEIPFTKEWEKEKKTPSSQFLQGIISNKFFINSVLTDIKMHYIDLYVVRLFLKWIKNTGIKSPCMMDIVSFIARDNGPNWLLGLLLSKILQVFFCKFDQVIPTIS